MQPHLVVVRRSVRALAAVAAAATLTITGVPLAAQQSHVVVDPSAAPRVERGFVAPYAGWLAPGSLYDGPLGTSMRQSTGVLAGAQLGFRLTPHVALVGHVARGAGDLTANAPFVGGVAVGSSTTWLYDGGLELRLGGVLPGRATSAVTPFVQLGAGAVRRDVASGPLSSATTSFAGNVGGGVDLALGRSLGLRVMAKDYIGRFDVREATGLPVDSKVTHNVALTAGITLRF